MGAGWEHPGGTPTSDWESEVRSLDHPNRPGLWPTRNQDGLVSKPLLPHLNNAQSQDVDGVVKVRDISRMFYARPDPVLCESLCTFRSSKSIFLRVPTSFLEFVH